MGSGDSSRSCDTSSQDLGYLLDRLRLNRILSDVFNSDLLFFYYSLTYFPAENLTEYKWPPDDSGEYYMLQEQVSEYLGVTSFKRKYPGKYLKKVIYPKYPLDLSTFERERTK